MKKNHEDRMALLDRLEKKYSKKVQLRALQKQQQEMKQSLRQMRGEHFTDAHTRSKVIDTTFYGGRRLVY